jgi:hypothetical protein
MNTEPAGLPVALRLRPHHRLLRVTPDRVRLGYVHAAVDVAELSAPLWHLMQLLPRRTGWRTVELISAGVALGAAPDEVTELLGRLHAAGALRDGTALARRDSARAQARVLVEGAGPLLVEVAAGLAQAGVGRIAVRAPAGIAREHAGSGRVRALLAEARTRAGSAGDVVSALALGTPDLVVFTDLLTPDPRHRLDLHHEKITHLVVQLVDGRGRIGPLVLPGRSSCLRCADLHRADGDEGWPIIAARAGELMGSASTATLQATAGFAVGQAAGFIDALATGSHPPTCVDAVLTLDTDAGTMCRDRWPAHTDCDCGAPTVVATRENPRRPAACTQRATR